MQEVHKTLLQFSHIDSDLFFEHISQVKLHSGQIKLLYFFLLHLLHIGLKHLKHLIPQLFSECFISLHKSGL